MTESRAGAAAVWQRNLVGEVSIMPSGTSLLEKQKKKLLPGFDLTQNWFSLVNLWKDKAVHR